MSVSKVKTKNKTSNSSNSNIIALVLLVLLENANVLITRFTRMNKDASDLYEIGHLVMLTEISKLTLATILEFFHTKNDFVKAFQRHNLQSFQGIKVALPAALYFLQNTLFYVALSNLPSPVFQVSYQMKLLITAFVSVILLGRKYTTKQWFCLLCLTIGIAVAILAEDKSPPSSSNNASDEASGFSAAFTTGLLAVVVASFCSALAGVTFEKFLKGNSSQQPQDNDEPPYMINPSLYMRNIQLAFFSILCALIQQIFKSINNHNNSNDDDEHQTRKSYFFGFSIWVWLLVFLRSSTGLLVAHIVKHMDTVVKGIASGISVLVGCVLAMFIFDTPLTVQFIFGALLVVPATYFFSNDMPKTMACCPQSTHTNVFSKNRTVFILILGIVIGQNLQYMPDPYSAVPIDFADLYVGTLASSTFTKGHTIPHDYAKELHFVIAVVNNRSTDLSSDSGGAKVLWGLHDALLERGFSVEHGYRNAMPCQRLLTEGRSKNQTTVIVWPEVEGMSCPGSNHSELFNVRWILAPVQKHVGVDTTKWAADDLIFNYATSTGENVPISNILQVLINPVPGDVTDIPRHVFESTNRSGIAWMLRKGLEFHSNITFIHNRTENSELNVTEIERSLDGPPSFESLREYEYFITYDPYTYWSWLAAMSGTVSVVYPLANTSKEEWALGTFIGSYMQEKGLKNIPGVAYGWTDEEIAYARSTMHELRDFLIKVKEWGANVTVPRFTRDAYRYKHGWVDEFEGALIKENVYP